MSSFHTELVDRVELVDIPPTQWHACKSVLRAIGKHANEQEADLAWPGVELLMLYTGASERVIVRTTTLLAKHGWITKKRRSGTSNIYRVNTAKLQKHQVERGPAKAVFMGQHLKGMAFPGEDLSHLTEPNKPGRSTARKRAKKAADQPTRQIGVKNTPDWREEHADLAGATRQIGDLSSREESEINKQTDSARELPAGLPGETKKPSTPRTLPESPGADLLSSLVIAGGAVTGQVIRQHHDTVTELLRTWPAEKLLAHLKRETSNGAVANPMGLLVSVLRDTQPIKPRRAPAKLNVDAGGACADCVAASPAAATNPKLRLRRDDFGIPIRIPGTDQNEPCPNCGPKNVTAHAS